VLVSSFIDIIKHYRNRKMNSKDWRYQQLAITAVLQKLGRRTWNTAYSSLTLPATALTLKLT
jgi:hypothetical protein